MQINFPEDLPVVAHRSQIVEAISHNQVVIIAGDTGSGKTTQIPKMCLPMLGKKKGLVGCTQPRRIAATSVSARVADELGNLGHLVGYKIRFHDYTTGQNKIKFMTDGVLLAETRTDPLLRQYSILILDEAHERSLNIDFLLGYLKGLLPQRPDLKLIVTSATIDTETFSRHFDDAPVINVSGRTFPVTVHYVPANEDESDDDTGYVEHCAETIANIYTNHPPGDILAFLPTEKEIRACCALVSKLIQGAIVLPMFGRLQSADQRKIFLHYQQPKIVIATNVAETSITVPGIRYVVDSGLARISYYNTRAKTTSLPVQRISRASCDQRKGRCGRIGPGVCFRLYTEEDYLQRDEFTLPEIKRSNLAEVILQMTSLKLGRPEEFPFVDPPHRGAIRDGYKLLQELGAINRQNTLTPIGRFMANLPIDPCISRILLEAKAENCVKEIKIIAAALAIQDPRIRPAEKEQQADTAHKKFAHNQSDFMTLLHIWSDFQQGDSSQRSWSKLKKYCKANFLSFQRMREWFDLHEQLDRLLKKVDGFTENTQDSSYVQIHKSLCTGFLRNIAMKKQAKIYQGAGNQELMIFPGSHQFTSAGQWIIAASFLETNRLYGLTVATIEPEWLEPLAPHLVKKSWSNPRWHKKTGQVIADERVALFGLIIVPSRKVNFPRRSEKNVPEARNIFIQEALIDDQLQGSYDFLDHNKNLIEFWREAEDKLRTTAIVFDDATLWGFYDRKLPQHVCDRASLNKYLRKKGHGALKMAEADILKNRPDENQLADYPTRLSLNSIELEVKYAFSPGSENDGMTVRIPASVASTLPPTYFEWLVPGLLHEKIHFLVKGLPKSLRKHLVPVNVSVDRILDDIDTGKGSLFSALERSIHKLFRVMIKRSDWPVELPNHLLARFELFDIEGKTIASGRELLSLVQEIPANNNTTPPEKVMSGSLQESLQKWQTCLVKNWDFEGLEEQIPILTATGELAGYLYPYLKPKVDKGAVAVEFSDERKQAVDGNFHGVEYLIRLQFPEPYKSLRKYCMSILSGPSSVYLLEAGIEKKKGVEILLSYALRAMFPIIDGTVPALEAYKRNIERVRQQGFYKLGREYVERAALILKKRREVYEKLNHYIQLDVHKHTFSMSAQEMFNDLLREIVPRDYFQTHDVENGEGTIKQLQSLAVRVERFYNNPLKDQEKNNLILPHAETLDRLQKHLQNLDEEAIQLYREYVQQVAEYRISIFSPEIKTTGSVSSKKLQQMRQKVLARCSI